MLIASPNEPPQMRRINFLKISKAKDRLSIIMIRINGIKENILNVKKLVIIKLIVVIIK